MTPIFVAETPSQFAKLAAAEGLGLVLELGSDIGRSASKWTYPHLIAYRLLTSPPKPFLATFDDHDTKCSLCRPKALHSQELNHKETTSLIDGPRPTEMLESSHLDLKRLPAGSFWIALARACSPDTMVEAKMYPERERQPVSRQDFVNSTHMQVGSSSPIQSSSPTSPSSGEADISMTAVDWDENEERRRKPEEVTVNLLNAFPEHVLYACLKQKQNGHGEVRVRIERKTNKITVGDREIAAEDDGGICRAKPAGHTWKVADDFVAIIEAKKAFQCIEDNGTMPVVSNETLAQYLAEAVITWKANQATLGQGVFLIAATSTLVWFMRFEFGSRYGEYLNATSVEYQKELVHQDKGEDTYARMESSKWFNLQTEEGRKHANCHTLALLRWHELQRSQDSDDADMSEASAEV